MKSRYKTKNRNQSLSLVGILLLSLGILAGILLVGRKQFFSQKATPSTHLILEPNKSVVEKGEQFEIYLTVDTGGNEFIGGEFYINFNPSSSIIVDDILLGDFLPNAHEEIKVIDQAEGMISYVVFIIPSVEVPFVKGRGQVGVIYATAVNPGRVNFDISENTLVAGVGEDEGENILQGITPASVEIVTLHTDAENDFEENSQTFISETSIPQPTKTSNPTLTPSTTDNRQLTTPAPFLTPTPTPKILIPGDLSGDDCITFRDFWLIVAKVGENSEGSSSDINNDGKFGWDDAWKVLNNISFSCQ